MLCLACPSRVLPLVRFVRPTSGKFGSHSASSPSYLCCCRQAYDFVHPSLFPARFYYAHSRLCRSSERTCFLVGGPPSLGDCSACVVPVVRLRLIFTRSGLSARHSSSGCSGLVRDTEVVFSVFTVIVLSSMPRT